jgi:hypothetical protein
MDHLQERFVDGMMWMADGWCCGVWIFLYFPNGIDMMDTPFDSFRTQYIDGRGDRTLCDAWIELWIVLMAMDDRWLMMWIGECQLSMLASIRNDS